MEKLKLENKLLISSKIKQYSLLNKIDFDNVLEDIYISITSEKDSIHLDVLSDSIKDLLNKSLYDTEEEIFHVVTFLLDEIYTKEVLDNCNEDDLNEVNDFLSDNFYDIFNNYFQKKGFINEDDYEECVLSLYNNYDMDEEISDILIGKFIEENIIKNENKL